MKESDEPETEQPTPRIPDRPETPDDRGEVFSPKPEPPMPSVMLRPQSPASDSGVSSNAEDGWRPGSAKFPVYSSSVVSHFPDEEWCEEKPSPREQRVRARANNRRRTRPERRARRPSVHHDTQGCSALQALAPMMDGLLKLFSGYTIQPRNDEVPAPPPPTQPASQETSSAVTVEEVVVTRSVQTEVMPVIICAKEHY